MQSAITTERAGQAHTEQRPRAALPPQRGWTWNPKSWKSPSWGSSYKSSPSNPTDTKKPRKRAATLSINDHELAEMPQNSTTSAIRFIDEPSEQAANKSDSPPPMSANPKGQEDLGLRQQMSIQVKRGEVQERLDREHSETCECRARVLIL